MRTKRRHFDSDSLQPLLAGQCKSPKWPCCSGLLQEHAKTRGVSAVALLQQAFQQDARQQDATGVAISLFRWSGVGHVVLLAIPAADARNLLLPDLIDADKDWIIRKAATTGRITLARS